MMRKILITLFIITSYLLNGQNFDSLVHVSLKLSSDTEKVNFFYKEGFENRLRSPQYSYNCAKQAEYFGLQSRSEKHLAKAYNLMGVLFYRKGDLKKALEFHQKALEIRQAIRDEVGIALSETNLGNIYSDLQKNEMAEKSYLSALQINNKLGNDKQTGNCYINIGVLKIAENKMDEAEKYFLNAYKIAKTIMDYELEAMCLNNLAVINIEKNNFEPAIGNSLDALKVKEIMGNEIEKADSYINLAKAYFKLGDQKNSDYYLNKADSLCAVYNYMEAKRELLKLRSDIYAANKKYDLAFNTYKSYIHLRDSINYENKMLAQEYNFVEERSETTRSTEAFKFPYPLLLTLFALSVFIIYYVFKNKK